MSHQFVPRPGTPFCNVCTMEADHEIHQTSFAQQVTSYQETLATQKLMGLDRESLAAVPPPPEETWAVVELMGRVKYAGRLAEVERFGGKLARLDIPQADGSFVTKFFEAAAVYTITFVTEAVARAVRHQTDPAPVQPWDFPKALNSPSEPATGEPVSSRTPARTLPCGHTPEDYCDCKHYPDDDRDDGYDPDDPDMPRW